jgi:hypothetical protein
MDERMPLLVIQKLSDIRCADFHFESGGDAVECFHALAIGFLAVLVQVDEAGRDDEAGCVNDASSAKRGGGDAGNFAVTDPDVAHRVEGSLRIEDSATFQDEIVLLGSGRCRAQKTQGQE